MYKILIFGAGVIGSIYAAYLANAGFDVSIYARSQRLQDLKNRGLLYKNIKDKKMYRANVKIIESINNDIYYDFIFVTVRYEQVCDALSQLRDIDCPNIVTMVNNPLGYKTWEEILGSGRLIPAFPGAGGKIEDGILYFLLTSPRIQATTFGELSGVKSIRIRKLANILKKSGFSIKICKNMDAWQKSHLAMVIPMANAIYFGGGDNYIVSKNSKVMRLLSLSLKENFHFLKQCNIPITPFRLNIFNLIPIPLLEIVLTLLYNTKFCETLIYNHAQKARMETMSLGKDFRLFANKNGYDLKYLQLNN